MRLDVDQAALLDGGTAGSAGVIAKKGDRHSPAMLRRTIVARLKVGGQVRCDLVVRCGKFRFLLLQLAPLRLEFGICSGLFLPQLGKRRRNLLFNSGNLV